MASRRNARTARPAAAIEATPDVIGDEGRAGIVADLVAGLQRQQFRLEAMQAADDLSDDEPIPIEGGSNVRSDGTIVTFGLRRQELAASEARLREAYPDLWERVSELVAQQA